MIRRYTDTPRDLLLKRWPNATAVRGQLMGYVEPIIEDVRRRGDEAVREYTRRFDGVDVEDPRVQPEEFQEAYNDVTPDQVEALKESKRRLEVVEARRLRSLSFDVVVEDIKIECSIRPLNSVGCYVPGGNAAYPSSLIMNAVPAKVAGVENIIVCTPPGENGRPSSLTLVAADICGVNAVYKVGGIQAIASMAYGTETIPRVDKIVGPGNRFVATAKIAVSYNVAIDKPAGPSEILVLADGSSDARIIALDLISQAEHGRGGVAGLVTTSPRLADEVEKSLEQLMQTMPRGKVVEDVLSKSGFIYTVESIEEAVNFVNLFAPEHLEIQTEEPRLIAERISTAGLVQIGPYTPVASTDYCAGVNHVLPTGGYSRFSSGTTVLDYLRLLSTVEATKPGLDKIRRHVKALAEAEGLPNHSIAVEGRFDIEAR
jgi:histidinol dehydrogenase